MVVCLRFFLDQNLQATRYCPAKIGICDDGVLQVHPGQVGPAQVYPIETGLSKIGMTQVGSMKICFFEIAPAQCRAPAGDSA